nr:MULTISPECIES: TnpV protein [Megamonas]
MRYLKQHHNHKVLYINLLTSGKLNSYILRVLISNLKICFFVW